MIEELKKNQAEVEFYDPWIREYRENGQVYKGLEKLDETIVSSYDLVMITTAHTNVDYEMVQKSAKVIFDTKNVMKNIKSRGNVELL